MSLLEYAIHPGEILRDEFLRGPGSVELYDLARRSGVREKDLQLLIAKALPFTWDLASKIGPALGTTAQFWMSMQTAYDSMVEKDKDMSTFRPLVRIKRLPHGEGLPLPSYESAMAAGCDLRAGMPEEYCAIPAGKGIAVPTGFAISLMKGWEAQIRPRSGITLSYGVTVANSPGTIDADYRGEVHVMLINHGDREFRFSRGDRIAQMVIAPVYRADFQEVDELDETARGESGFGSTGK